MGSRWSVRVREVWSPEWGRSGHSCCRPSLTSVAVWLLFSPICGIDVWLMCAWLETDVRVSVFPPSPSGWTPEPLVFITIKIIRFNSRMTKMSEVVSSTGNGVYLKPHLFLPSTPPFTPPPHSSSSAFQTPTVQRGVKSWCFSQPASTLENLPPPSSVKVKF